MRWIAEGLIIVKLSVLHGFRTGGLKREICNVRQKLNTGKTGPKTTSHLKNVILSPSHVILSAAKNLLFTQGKLHEGSLNGEVETLTALRSAHVSVAANAPSE